MSAHYLNRANYHGEPARAGDLVKNSTVGEEKETAPRNPDLASPLSRLSYPGALGRLRELAMGSARREALRTIRAASPDQWQYVRDPAPQLLIDAGHSSLLLVYEAPEKLKELHFVGRKTAVHLDGECELAQRLARYVARAYLVLRAPLNQNSLAHLRKFACGEADLPSTYAAVHEHRHIAPGGFIDTKRRTATVEVPSGVIELQHTRSRYRVSSSEYPEVSQAYLEDCVSRQMEIERLTRMMGRVSYVETAPDLDFYRQQLRYLSTPQVAPPAGVTSEFDAVLKSPKLTELARLFGANADSEHLLASEELIDAALGKAAEANQPRTTN